MARSGGAWPLREPRRRQARSLPAVLTMATLVAGSVAVGQTSDNTQTGPVEARAAALWGLALVTREGRAWVREQGCVSCHHGPMLLWVLGLARQRGIAVDQEALAEVRREALDSYLEHDFRPTPGLDTAPLSLGALYVALGATAGGEIPATVELGRFRDHLRQTQQPDGSWAAPDLIAPDRAVGRTPPLYDTREVTTRWAVLALAGLEQAQTEAESDPTIQRALEWLKQQEPAADTQAAAVRLLTALRIYPGAQVEARRRELLARQNADGGWSQVTTGPSDAFATGQALYALGKAGMTERDIVVGRAWGYLTKTQRGDGSWLVASRAEGHLEIATSYCGTAWAVIGLLATLGANEDLLQEPPPHCLAICY
jgi:hypothetical protein